MKLSKILFIFSLLIFLGLLFFNFTLSGRITQQKVKKVEKIEKVTPTSLPEECSQDKGFNTEGMTVYRWAEGVKIRMAWEGRVKKVSDEKIIIGPMTGGEEEKEILKENMLFINIVGERDEKRAFLPIRENGGWEEIKVGNHVTFNFQKPDLEEGILVVRD